jgi:hypothetical protein
MASGTTLTDFIQENSSGSKNESEYGLSDTVSYKDVHCTSCQRRGRKTKGAYYCQDCKVGLCHECASGHTKDVKLNRHSVSVISKTFLTTPNQGPYPELTEIGTIKFDVECSLKGSTFLPNGELVVTDFTNSKIRVFSSDYTRKPVASFLIPKQNKWDEKRPKPLDITATGPHSVAFTADNGCIYMVTVGATMVIKIERVIPVINFESNYGECLGLAFNNIDKNLYVGCGSDREGVYIKIYGLDGEVRRVVRDGIIEPPNYLTFGIDKSRLYAANADSVTVYDIRDFSVVEEFTELQAQTTDIIVDKYGYLYTLALERRTFNKPGSVYRLNSDKGVTKVTDLTYKPSSVSYSMKTDDIAVTFEKSRYIFLFKLKLRTFQKPFGGGLMRYKDVK